MKHSEFNWIIPNLLVLGAALPELNTIHFASILVFMIHIYSNYVTSQNHILYALRFDPDSPYNFLFLPCAAFLHTVPPLFLQQSVIFSHFPAISGCLSLHLYTFDLLAIQYDILDVILCTRCCSFGLQTKWQICWESVGGDFENTYLIGMCHQALVRLELVSRALLAPFFCHHFYV